jgi:hypothetical protein
MKSEFPNLARLSPTPIDVVAEVTAITEQELWAAGIDVSTFDFPIRGEVPTHAFGVLSTWHFERCWYYWVAKGPGLPPEIADRLHETHGKEVRVDGHCMCPSPREWLKGFAVGMYHVDTPAGLKALADAILSVYDPSKDPEATPHVGLRRPGIDVKVRQLNP